MHSAPTLILALLTFGPLSIPLPAQEPQAPIGEAQTDPSGTWRRQYEWSGAQVEEVARLNLKANGKVVGRLFRNDVAYDIADGRYDNRVLSFSVTDDDRGTPWTTRFSGVIRGDSIEGTVALSGNGQTYEWPWTPTRSVRMEDVLGTWNFRVVSPNGGTREPTLKISQQGDHYAGAYQTMEGSALDVTQLRIELNRLLFTVSGEYNGGPFQVDYQGRPYGDRMRGAVDYDFSGNTGRVEFTAVRESGPMPSATGSAGIAYRGSYFVNGEIHVNTYGTPEGRPLTSGHQDFKPSWSKTGDMLVFFRRLQDDPVVTNWKTAICIIRVDGTGFHQLTDGTHTDFNQTWTRDGTNTPIWNRKNPETGGFYVMRSRVGNSPGQEEALTDKRYHTWAYTCLKDGRILVQSMHPQQGYGYFLMTANAGGEPRFERIDCEWAARGILDRVSVSPSEARVCFEYQKGFEYKDAGRTLYLADFNADRPSITNAKAFANAEGVERWFAYPRWTKDEAAIVYHASPSLYLYTLKDGSTRKVSMNDRADYRYPHGEATPK